MGLLIVSSGVTMAVPFALGRIIDIIYEIDQTKDEKEQKKQFDQNLKRYNTYYNNNSVCSPALTPIITSEISGFVLV